MTTQVINFLTNKGQFDITAQHSTIEQAIESTRVKNLISKKDKLRALKIKNNFFFLVNDNIIADQMITEENGVFYMKELTVQSLNKLESEI